LDATVEGGAKETMEGDVADWHIDQYDAGSEVRNWFHFINQREANLKRGMTKTTRLVRKLCLTIKAIAIKR
jgi:hypothetical protein